jgi:hypothetical protein
MQRELLKPHHSPEQLGNVDATGSFYSLAIFHPGYKDKIRPRVYLTKLLERPDIGKR